ncbi:MAG: cytochrome C oxidase subunit IV family protein [Gemmatimonadales bacterium]|nr:cytochrome C oxidase subunit IV family protein [Gemmatimonadales bacterium]
MSHVTTAPTIVPDHEHAHPGVWTYVKIGIVLFAITALEIGAYEFGYHRTGTSLGALLHPIVVPVLLVLSAIKFALVAMYYMHLKPDSRLFSGVFIFSLIIAAIVIFALIALFAYHFAFQKMIP